MLTITADITQKLKDRANGLAIAQLAAIHDNVSWGDAYDELVTLGKDDIPTRFTPVEQYDHLSMDQLFSIVDTEADAILAELKAAFELGVQQAQQAA